MTKDAAPLTFALGLPNNRTARAVIDEHGKPTMQLPNQLRLLPQTAALLARANQMEWFPKPADAPRTTSGPVVNVCADFDTYSRAFVSMVKWFPSGATIFNHPNAIAALHADSFKRRISGIEGLEVPVSIRFCPETPDDFATIFEKEGFAFPVRVQMTSARNNSSAVVIGSSDDWTKALALNWPGKWFNMVQMNPQDLRQHARYRVCFVGQQAEITTFPYTYPPNPIFREIKPTHLTNAPAVKKICSALSRHVLLDCWSAELSVRSADHMQLEYIWAGLPVEDQEGGIDPSAVLWPKIAPLLHSLVQAPHKWRSWQGPRESKAN